MPIELRKDGNQLVWVRNPFTGTVTYFTDIHKKRSGFRLQPPAVPADRTAIWQDSEVARRSELEGAQRNCPFCPGNEELTTEEVFRLRPDEVCGCAPTDNPWLIRSFYNIIPRIPASCTGGRNESYVVVEDPRHFADDARHHEELLYTALLPEAQFQAILRANVEVTRIAYTNPTVQAVLVRKNQGRESGASQPHLHSQVIGSDQPFSPVVQEHQTLAGQPKIWQEILAFAEQEDFLIDELDGCFLYFCPFGIFPRSYEIVCPDVRARVTNVSTGRLESFGRLLHRALAILGPLPLDYERQHGSLVLHNHV
jgi:galactose-1-phosphate uridylyltransferase